MSSEYNFLLGLPWWPKQGLLVYLLPWSGLLGKRYKPHSMLTNKYHWAQIHALHLWCFTRICSHCTFSQHIYSVATICACLSFYYISFLLSEKNALHLASPYRWAWITNRFSSYTNSHIVFVHVFTKKTSDCFMWWHRNDCHTHTQKNIYRRKVCLLIETWCVLIEKSGNTQWLDFLGWLTWMRWR